MQILAALLILALGIAGCSQEEEPVVASGLTAVIADYQGTVQVLKTDGTFVDASNGLKLVVDDQVLAHPGSWARIEVADGAIIRVEELTSFRLQGLKIVSGEGIVQIRLDTGELWAVMGGGLLEVETPFGKAAVRQTSIQVRVDQGGAYVSCLEGGCMFTNAWGDIYLEAVQKAAAVDPNTMPMIETMTDPEVQRWIQMNPDAVMVQTLQPTPEALMATPTNLTCGPPAGWVTHTVRSDETLQVIAAMYYITVGDLQYANCLGTSNAIVAGQVLYVPDLSTPTPVP